MNNPFYVLSEQYKKDQKKKKQAHEPELNTCIMCIWCKSSPRTILNGEFEGWCDECRDSDLYIADWQEACWAESLKPANEQNTKVYHGKFGKYQ